MGSLLGLALRDSNPDVFEQLARLTGQDSETFIASLGQEDYAREHAWKRRLFIDINVTAMTTRYLQNAGFHTVPLNENVTRYAVDEDVFKYAWQEGAIIITHDKDFLNAERFNYLYSGGVVILPTPMENGVSHTPKSCPAIKAALDHFILNLPHQICGWIYIKVAEYGREGELRLYPNAPSRPIGEGKYRPEVAISRYL